MGKKKSYNFHTWLQTIVSVVALILAFKAYRDANKQFEENSKKSEELFNKQQRIINNQLEISEKQYYQMLKTARPKIKYNFSISTYSYNGTKYTGLEFALNLINNGNRSVTNLRYLCFFLDKNITEEYKVNVKTPKELKPEEFFDSQIQYNINGKEEYLYFKISYYDAELKETHFEDVLYKLNKNNENLFVSNCYFEEISKIKTYIKKKYHFNPLVTPDSISPSNS